MGRIAAGWRLAKLSLGVVRSDGSLSVLVILGGIASGAVALGFLVPAAIAYGIEEKWLAAVLTVIGVYLATLVGTYFAVALAAAAGVLGSAARAVFAVALYRYAAGAGATGPFSDQDLESAVARKR